jgi:tetratricopeptide (TPR) repeat protein
LGKYELARKELAQAARLEKTNRRSGVVQINQALLELQAEGFVSPKRRSRRRKSKASLFELQQAENLQSKVKNPKAIELLQEGLQLAGSGICGFFRVIVEAKSQWLDLANILPLLPILDKRYLSTRHEVLELVRLINAYSEEGMTFITEAVVPLSALLQKAATLEFYQEEMLSLCECFKKLKHNKLLRQFAEQALKRWPKQPIFVFYQVYSKSGFWQISDIVRLRNAADKAREQGDQRTAMMIVTLLNEMMPRPSFSPFNAFDEEFYDIESELEALKNMDLNDITPAELIRLINRLESLGIEIPDLPIPRQRGNR